MQRVGGDGCAEAVWRFGEFKMPVVKVGRDDTVEEDVVRLVRGGDCAGISPRSKAEPHSGCGVRGGG